MKHQRSCNSLLCAFIGDVDSFGRVALKCKFGDVENHLLYVVDNALPLLLRLKTCFSMVLLKIVCIRKPETPLECNFLLSDYSDVFKVIGCLAQTYSILIDNNMTPVRCPPRRISLAFTNKVKVKQVTIVAQHLIELVNEHSD